MTNNSEESTKSSGGSTPETETSSYGKYQQLNQKEVRFSFDLTLGDYFRIPDSSNNKILTQAWE